MRIRFLTSTPLDIRRGSGTYVGIHVLGRALEKLGHTMAYETPQRHSPSTRWSGWCSTAGCARRRNSISPWASIWMATASRAAAGHVASLKGVIADEVRFESGLTRLTMSLQARCERLHVHRAARVLVTSGYSAAQAKKLYGLRERPAIVPELIDLQEWRRMLADHPASERRLHRALRGPLLSAQSE